MAHPATCQEIWAMESAGKFGHAPIASFMVEMEVLQRTQAS